ncbi:UxaA family hydrolase [Chloroflexota bacterium]
MGYPRPDGSVGTRNYVGIFSTVTCSCDIAQDIANQVQGTVSFLHYEGCDHLQPDKELVERTLANLGRNPNLAAVLLVSLGCEVVDTNSILDSIAQSGKPIAKVTVHEIGGTSATISEGARIASQMVSDASKVKREKLDDANLMFGCVNGSSDATSGLASNPVIGSAYDILVENNGSAVFSQTTEFIGAEHILARRGASPEVKHKILNIVNRYEQLILSWGVDMRGGNPTRGNIEGGLTTIEEKSLGTISKGGSKPIKQVYDYGERPEGKGLFIVDGPGQDTKAMTALAAAGAQVILFSTGRGSPIGFPFVPVVKVTANAATYQRMNENMDVFINIADLDSVETQGQLLYNEVMEIASGRLTKAEILGLTNFGGIHTFGPTL